jgi:inosine-uridine nucleoside N-ribohydrolase
MANAMTQTPLNLIIDTDPGIDDACALLAALASPRLRVRAIIASGGNVQAAQALLNVRRVLAVAQPVEMPLLGLGLDAPGKGLEATHIHGPDGLGEAPVAPLDLPALDACDAVRRVLLGCEGEVALLALAPLTTVRFLLADVPGFRARLSQVVVMGGAVRVPGRGGWAPGNVTPVAEFNFWRDPEAASALLHLRLPIRLVPLNVTERWEVTSRALRDHIRGRSRRAAFLRHILRYAIRSHEKVVGRGALVHDAVALAGLLRPGLFRWQPLYLDVEARGTLTRGMVVADTAPPERVPAKRHLHREPNAQVAVGVRVGALADHVWGLLR